MLVDIVEKIKFKKEFYRKEFEMLVLTKEESSGAGMVYGNYTRANLRFVASVNLETGEFKKERGILEWFNKGNGKVKYSMEKYKIYQVRVRKCKETDNNSYMLISVIKEVLSNEKLDKEKQELFKIVTNKNHLGEFKLDREFDRFEGEIEWLSTKCQVFLDTDVEDGIVADKSFNILYKIVDDMKNLDTQIRQFAADELTSLANHWRDEETEEISKETFMKNIKMLEIEIGSEGIAFWFKDSDMFWGHDIQVLMSSDYKFEEANIVG